MHFARVWGAGGARVGHGLATVDTARRSPLPSFDNSRGSAAYSPQISGAKVVAAWPRARPLGPRRTWDSPLRSAIVLNLDP
jgi:hypothetical protein